jgi:hypothetical protein
MGEGAGGTVDSIVNGLSKGWEIIKDNKPASSAKTSFCQAIPGNIPFNKLYGWQTETVSWGFELQNIYGMKVVDVAFQLDCLWHGQTDSARGLFLNNFNVWCKSIDVLIGFHVDVDATVSGNPFNSSGDKTAAVGAITLIVSVQVSGVFQNKTKSWKITCHGNGKRDVA